MCLDSVFVSGAMCCVLGRSDTRSSSELLNLALEAFQISKSFYYALFFPTRLCVIAVWKKRGLWTMLLAQRGLAILYTISSHRFWCLSTHCSHVIFYCYCDGHLSFLPHPEGFGFTFQTAIHTSAPYQRWNTWVNEILCSTAILSGVTFSPLMPECLSVHHIHM